MASPTRRAVSRYAESHAELRGVTDDFVALVTAMLDEAGINYLSVSGRTKSVDSFAGKVRRRAAAGTPFVDPLAEITDQVGVRVITYVASDVAAVAELLADQLTVLDDRDLGLETAGEGRFGYASRHLLVSRDRPAGPGDEVAYDPTRSASVQLRTVLQHAWAEFEHDIRYKGTVPEQLVADPERRVGIRAVGGVRDVGPALRRQQAVVTAAHERRPVSQRDAMRRLHRRPLGGGPVPVGHRRRGHLGHRGALCRTGHCGGPRDVLRGGGKWLRSAGHDSQ